MSTAGEVGDAAARTFSYEGEGGSGVAGGKFRKRPLRGTSKTTPYDRPVNALRGITRATNENNGGWLTKFVVDPASKLISYGADRFFSSFRKRLPAPAVQPPEASHELNGGFQRAVNENQPGGEEPASDNGSHPISSGGISEVEQLLKQKTFTRSEIEHLTELLRSKAVEVPNNGDYKTRGDALQKPLTVAEGHKRFSSASLEKNKTEDRSHGIISTPIASSKAFDDEIASPAELAKAYMGSRPSNVSPSMLGMRNQAVMDDSRMLSNPPFTPIPPTISFPMKNAEVQGYGFATPISRGKSATYGMARTPYSRVYPAGRLKGTRSINKGHELSSLSSRLVAEDDGHVHNNSALKRRSSTLDDDLGSFGPIRRIRHKPTLLSHRSPLAHGVETGTNAAEISMKQKLPLEDEPRHKVSKTINNNASTSYAGVPSKSSEVAARILQHLEKISPKEKPSESKTAATQDKLPAKLTPISLKDGHKLEGWPKASLSCAGDSTSQKCGKENSPKNCVDPHGMLTAATNIDNSLAIRSPRSINEISGSGMKTSELRPPQQRRAIDMIAHEDDKRYSNGLAPQPLGDKKGTTEMVLSDGNPSPAEMKLDKPTIQFELKSLSSPSSGKPTDMQRSSVVTVGKGNTVFHPFASQAPSTSFESSLLPQPVFNFDKTKEVNNSPPLFSFNSKVDEKVPSFAFSSSPPELSNRKPFLWSESKPDTSSSLANVLSTATCTQQKIPESEKDGNENNQKAGNEVGKSEKVPSVTSNGSLVSSPPVLFTPPGIADSDTSGTASSASSSCHVGWSNVVPSPNSGIFDPSTAISAPSTSTLSEPAISQSKAEKATVFSSLISDTHSGTSSFATSSGTGKHTFALGSSLASSTANGQSQDSFVGAASRFLMPAAQTGSPATSIQLGTSAPFSVFSSTLVGSSSIISQPSSPSNNFGLASSSAVNGIRSENGPMPSLFKFGASSSNANAVSSSSGATGLSSSCATSGTNTVCSSIGASFGLFSFTGSSASTSGINSASSSIGSSLFTSSSSSTPSGSSMLSSSSSLPGFSFGAASASFAANTTVASNLTAGASSSPIFSFSAASTAALSSPALAHASPVFSNFSSPFAASEGNNNNNNDDDDDDDDDDDRMSNRDSMAEDPVQSAPPPVFGQPFASPPSPSFFFGSANPSQANPFQFGGQSNQPAQQNASPFQASTIVHLNTSGNFSIGSGGGGDSDKSGRRIIKVNRNKNRKK